MLGQVSLHPDLLRQVSITVKVFCVHLKLKAIILLQLHRLSLKRLLGLVFFRSSIFLKAHWKWLDYIKILLIYLWVICRSWSPLRVSFLFSMYFSFNISISVKSNQPLGHFSLSSISINLISSTYFFVLKESGSKTLQKMEIPEPFMHFKLC